MKHVSEIQIPNNQNQLSDLTIEQKQSVAAFVGSIFEIYPGYDGSFRLSEPFKSQCRIHAKGILESDNEQRSEILNMILRIKDLNGKELKFLGSYKTAQSALAMAAFNPDTIRHDFHRAFPQQPTNEWKILMDESEKNKAPKEKAYEHLEKIKKILNGGDNAIQNDKE